MGAGAGAVGKLLAGLVAGAACVGLAALAAVVSRAAWRPHGALVPWGLMLAVGSSASSVVLARAVSRWMGWAAAAGWIVGLIVLLGGRPEGDYVLAADGLGDAFLVAAPLAVLIVAGWASSTGP